MVKSDGLSTRPERPEEPLTDLERSEFYLREGERLAHMGSWSLKSDGTFDYWSPETFAIFDFDPSQGIPTLPKWLSVLHPDDRDLLAKTIERMFRESVRGDVTYRVDHPKHGRRIMHSTGEPVVEGGNVTRLIGNTLIRMLLYSDESQARAVSRIAIVTRTTN
jgi:PAS domain-containing protein